MSNEGNLVCGLIPLPDAKGEIDVRPKIRISAGLNTDSALFRGSPYELVDGTVVAAAIADAPIAVVAGAVVKLYDSTGTREVLNLPIETAGYADVTYRKDQRYEIVASGDGFADDGSDNGVTYGLTIETGTANSNGRDGSSNSGVMLDTAQEDPSANTFMASFKVNKPRNIGGADRTLIEGTINPACYQAW